MAGGVRFCVVSCLFVCFYVLAIPDYWPVVPKYGSLSLHLNDCHCRDDERSMGSKRTYPKQHPEKNNHEFRLDNQQERVLMRGHSSPCFC